MNKNDILECKSIKQFEKTAVSSINIKTFVTWCTRISEVILM